MATTITITGARAAGQRIKQTLDSFVGRQALFAARQTINQLAYESQQFVNRKMPEFFDRPNAVTRQATKYRTATKEKLVASVYIDDFSAPDRQAFYGQMAPGAIGRAQQRTTGKAKIPPTYWLRYGVYGGARVAKSFERLFREIGILRGGEFVVPGSAAALDQFGNVPGAFINFVYNYFKTAKKYSGENEPVSEARKKFLRGERAAGSRVGKRNVGRPGFDIGAVRRVGRSTVFKEKALLGYRQKSGQVVGEMIIGGQGGRSGHLKRGLYVRVGPGRGRLQCILKFVRQPTYRIRLPFHGMIQSFVENRLEKTFAEQYQRAILNAKPVGAPSIPTAK